MFLFSGSKCICLMKLYWIMLTTLLFHRHQNVFLLLNWPNYQIFAYHEMRNEKITFKKKYYTSTQLLM